MAQVHAPHARSRTRSFKTAEADSQNIKEEAFSLACFPKYTWQVRGTIPAQTTGYPGPRGFSWFFFAKEIKSKPRSGHNESRKRRGERENLWLPRPRISLSCRRQGQDLTLGRWLVDIFSNTQTNLIGSFNCNYRGDAEDFHTSFCLSLPGKKIVCMLHSQ